MVAMDIVESTSLVATEPQSAELVSVIIPNYNHGRYLGAAIQSILDQDYRPVEIIIVDDGSTDGSSKVAAKFGGQVRYIWQENQGLSAARNTGLAAATGAYVGLLDADDVYEPDFISTLVAILAQRPEIDGVHCGYRFVDEHNETLPQVEARHVPEGQLYDTLLNSNFLVPESVLVRRHCYEAIGPFDESLRACEDWDMWLRLSHQFRFTGTERVLTRHRILAGSMSTDPQRMLDNRLAVLDKHFGGESAAADAGPAIQYAYGRAYLASCVEYLQYGDLEQAYACLFRMSRVCPNLLAELDTFYQLGCGNQPKGQMGDFASLDLATNSQNLFGLLDKLVTDDRLSEAAWALRRPMLSQAYYALALLHYGQRQFAPARRHFWSAAWSNPWLLGQRQFLSTWLRALLGARGQAVVDRLRGWRKRA